VDTGAGGDVAGVCGDGQCARGGEAAVLFGADHSPSSGERSSAGWCAERGAVSVYRLRGWGINSRVYQKLVKKMAKIGY